MSSTPRTRGTRALPPTSCATPDRPVLSAWFADWWSQWRTPPAAVPFTESDEDGQYTNRVLTSFAITVVMLLFITLVIPTIIGLVLNF